MGKAASYRKSTDVLLGPPTTYKAKAWLMILQEFKMYQGVETKVKMGEDSKVTKNESPASLRSS